MFTCVMNFGLVTQTWYDSTIVVLKLLKPLHLCLGNLLWFTLFARNIAGTSAQSFIYADKKEKKKLFHLPLQY